MLWRRSFTVPLREDRLLLEITLALLKTIHNIAPIEPSESGFAKDLPQKNPALGRVSEDG